MDEMKSDDDTIVKTATGDEDKNTETVNMDEDKNKEAGKMDKDINSEAVKINEDKNSNAVKMDEDKNSGAVKVDEDKTAGNGDSTDASILVPGSPTELTGSPTAQSGSPVGQNDAPAARKKKLGKVDILFKATGDAPIMKRSKWSVEESRSVGAMIDFLRKYLKREPQQSIFIYVNQSFAPSPDVAIGVLYECFGSDGKLVLHYCMTQAWG